MAGSPKVGRPSTVTFPADGRSRPATRWSSVLLPAPFGPRRPVTPGSRLNVMSLTATTLPYHFATALTSTVGGAPTGLTPGRVAPSWLIGAPSPLIGATSCLDPPVPQDQDDERGDGDDDRPGGEDRR